MDAQARRWGRLVVVLLAGLRFLWGDVGVGEDLEGMGGRHQPDRVLALLELPALGGGLLLDGQLGQRVGLQPLVGDRLAAADRPAVAAGGQPGLGPLQRRPPCSQELVDGQAGLLGVAPVGVVDFIAKLGRRWFTGRSLQQLLEPVSLAGEQRPCPGLVHQACSGTGICRYARPRRSSQARPGPRTSRTRT
jgi:hypothetical protein